MVHHAPQNNNTSIQPKSVPTSASPRYARFGNHTHYGYAAGKLLATIDFSVSDIRKWAVLDSGATGNFLVTDAPLNDRTEAHEPLTVTLPDGNRVNSTHVGLLDIPRLPRQARIGHVIPGPPDGVRANEAVHLLLQDLDTMLRPHPEVVAAPVLLVHDVHPVRGVLADRLVDIPIAHH